MYVFRADHLGLDSQLVCSSPGKTISSALSTSWMSVGLWVELRSRVLSLGRFSMSAAVLLVLLILR